MKGLSIRCMVTENRTGRLGGDDSSRKGRRFIYVADYTGFLSLGMISSETGVMKYDVEEQICDERSRCFFNDEITGTFAWIPTRNNEEVPTFFLNNGTASKRENVSWTGESRLMFPTSGVCRQLVKSKFAGSACFMTTGFCGNIDLCFENADGDVLISLEDPVGYFAMEIATSEAGCAAKEYMERNEICIGNYVFASGKTAIDGFINENAVLKEKREDIVVHVVKKGKFDEFVEILCDTEAHTFRGIAPEQM